MSRTPTAPTQPTTPTSGSANSRRSLEQNAASTISRSWCRRTSASSSGRRVAWSKRRLPPRATELAAACTNTALSGSRARSIPGAAWRLYRSGEMTEQPKAITSLELLGDPGGFAAERPHAQDAYDQEQGERDQERDRATGAGRSRQR